MSVESFVECVVGITDNQINIRHSWQNGTRCRVCVKVLWSFLSSLVGFLGSHGV